MHIITMTWHRCLTTIYFKSQDSKVGSIRNEIWLKSWKKRFSWFSASKYVICGVELLDSIISHANHYKDMIQTPHDHLFQKSGDFLDVLQPNTLSMGVLFRFHHFTCISLQSHDREASRPFISKIGAAKSAFYSLWVEISPKIANSEVFLV